MIYAIIHDIVSRLQPTAILIYIYIYIYILKNVYRRSYAEPHPNPIRKFELESNLKLAEPENEPEPCDIGYIQPIQP